MSTKKNEEENKKLFAYLTSLFFTVEENIRRITLASVHWFEILKHRQILGLSADQ